MPDRSLAHHSSFRSALRTMLRPRRIHAFALATILLVCGAALGVHELAAIASPEGVDAAPEASLLRRLPDGTRLYISRQNGSQADPVNLAFRVDDGARVATEVMRVLGWKPVEASPMSFRYGSATRTTGWQLELPLGGGSRFHMRIEAATAVDGQEYVLAAVHRDDTVGCGHIGNAFDMARDLVARAFGEAGYRVTTENAGNVEAGPQCDGSVTAGDGAVAFIDLSQDSR